MRSNLIKRIERIERSRGTGDEITFVDVICGLIQRDPVALAKLTADNGRSRLLRELTKFADDLSKHDGQTDAPGAVDLAP